ncbi:MAG: uroporphyrinogen-III C-methyltransferase [Planctomycetes bacterium]|nr:uroporphyrinogen-III C-methyltransferase [Planctomycetota bacterium]
MSETGEILLVGAGPGDPDLMTVAGRSALATAEVVLYDHLVGEAIIALIPATATAIDVGKSKGRHSLSQPEINALIVEHAQAGKRVVRLKGGDPFLFGRGGEELVAARDHNLACRVVPGVSSALAAPALAGIPLTHRDLASSVHILTGHGKDGVPPPLAYPELLEGTLVFLMAVSSLDTVCAGLLAAGRAADTPAALVENASLPEQRLVTGRLDSIARLALEQAVSSPAVVVVGAVCGLADAAPAADCLPLSSGRRILAAGSRSAVGRLAATLRAAGAAVDPFTAIRREGLSIPEAMWRGLPNWQWVVFTSQTGVRLFFAAARAARLDFRRLAGLRFAVVGGRTAAALADCGITADFIPECQCGRDLAVGLAERMAAGDTALLFQAEDGNPEVAAILRQRQVTVQAVAAYRTQVLPPPPVVRSRLRDRDYAVIAVTSASAVAAVAAASEQDLTGQAAVCLGEMTAAAAGRFGLRVTVAGEPSLEALAAAALAQMEKSCR